MSKVEMRAHIQQIVREVLREEYSNVGASQKSVDIQLYFKTEMRVIESMKKEHPILLWIMHAEDTVTIASDIIVMDDPYFDPMRPDLTEVAKNKVARRVSIYSALPGIIRVPFACGLWLYRRIFPYRA